MIYKHNNFCCHIFGQKLYCYTKGSVRDANNDLLESDEYVGFTACYQNEIIRLSPPDKC